MILEELVQLRDDRNRPGVLVLDGEILTADDREPPLLEVDLRAGQFEGFLQAKPSPSAEDEQKLPARLGGVHEVAKLLAIDVVPVLLHRVVLSEPVEGVEGDEVVAEGVIEELASMTDLLVNRRRRHYAGLAAFIDVGEFPACECRLERTSLDSGDRIKPAAFAEVTDQITSRLLMKFHRAGSEFGLSVGIVAFKELRQLGGAPDITPAGMCFQFDLLLTTHLLRLPLGDRVHTPEILPWTTTIRCHPADDPVGVSFRCLLVESDALSHDLLLLKAFPHVCWSQRGSFWVCRLRKASSSSRK
ncbi:MAG: hypothetical protein WA746_25270 [Isosphaeraceae bacterium]